MLFVWTPLRNGTYGKHRWHFKKSVPISDVIGLKNLWFWQIFDCHYIFKAVIELYIFPIWIYSCVSVIEPDFCIVAKLIKWIGIYDRIWEMGYNRLTVINEKPWN